MSSLGSSLGFTPARGSDIFSARSTDRPGSRPGRSLDGEKVREFYENLLQDGEPGQNHRSNRRARRRTRARPAETRPAQTSSERGAGTGHSEQTAELMGLRFLRCAQEGDLPGLQDLISKGVDINFQDSFFWTALMCACWSGQRAATKLLLKRGAAWVGVVDVRGRDARDLAMAAGHSHVLEELDTFGSGEEARCHPELSSAEEVRWCHTCNSSFSGAAHLTSTLHQFSQRRPPPTPSYCLPPSANGFKMMVRCGWNPGSGLGPEGNGPGRPVATVLKRDHAGLGYGPPRKPKVTHFRARDHAAVGGLRERSEEQLLGRGARREQERRREVQDQNWERDFRTSFYL